MALTKKDLDQIKMIVGEVIDDAVSLNNAKIALTIDDKVREHQLVTKDDISHLPSKHDFYNKMDEVLGEVVKEREENTIQQAKLEEHTERLEKIESKLNLSVA